jgi:hypothetical protein
LPTEYDSFAARCDRPGTSRNIGLPTTSKHQSQKPLILLDTSEAGAPAIGYARIPASQYHPARQAWKRLL